MITQYDIDRIKAAIRFLEPTEMFTHCVGNSYTMRVARSAHAISLRIHDYESKLTVDKALSILELDRNRLGLEIVDIAIHEILLEMQEVISITTTPHTTG